MHKRRILVVDDDTVVLKFLRDILKSEGYEPILAANGIDALTILKKEPPNLMLIDIIMSPIDGIELCRQVRQFSNLPIIMVSARDYEYDKVKCLDLGADDYITKPFSTKELLARIRAIFRRIDDGQIVPESPVFKKDKLKIDFAARKVIVNNREIKLTPTEYCLLRELALNSGKVLTHKYLLQKVWGVEYLNETEYLHVFIGRLRTKLEHNPLNPKHIATIPGVGYELSY